MPLMYIGFCLTIIALIISALVITFFGDRKIEDAPSPLTALFSIAGVLVFQLVGSVAFGDTGIFVLGIFAVLMAIVSFITYAFLGKTMAKVLPRAGVVSIDTARKPK